MFANTANGMTAVVIENGVLKLNYITPGDKVEFNINVTNNSNVDIQYRTIPYISGALANYLTWSSSVVDWTYVDGEDDIAPVQVSIEFPENITYEMLGGVAEYKAEVLFTVEAIQGNGDKAAAVNAPWDGTVPTTKPDTLVVDTANYLISVNDTKAFVYLNTLLNDPDFAATYGSKWKYSIDLNTDVDLANRVWTPIVMSNFVAFNGNNHTIKNVYAVGGNSVGLFGVISSNDKGYVEVKDFTVDGVYAKGEKYVGGAVGNSPQGMLENVVVKNATVIGTKYVGGLFGSGNGGVTNCKVMDTTVTIPSGGEKEAGGLIGYLSNNGKASTENKIIAGNVVENVTVKAPTIASGLVSQPNSSNVGGAKIVIENNTMKNVTILTEDLTAALYASNNVGGKSIVRNNTAENCNIGAEAYGLTLIPGGDTTIHGTIYVNDKEGLLNLTNLVNDWVALFSDGNGTGYSNYANHDFYYDWTWKIELTADIDFENAEIDPIQLGKKSYFNGNSHTIKNAVIKMDAATTNEAGLFNAAQCGMRNLTLDNIQVTGSVVGGSTAGVLSGSCNSGYGVQNITVKNSSVYGGKYTGGIVGYGYTSVTNCTVENTTVKGGYKLGGIIGYICASNAEGQNVTGNTLKDCTVDGIGGGVYAGGKDRYIVGKVVGNYNCNGTCNNNTVTNMTTSATTNIGEIEAGKTVTE